MRERKKLFTPGNTKRCAERKYNHVIINSHSRAPPKLIYNCVGKGVLGSRCVKDGVSKREILIFHKNGQ